MTVSKTGRWGLLLCSLLILSACSAKRPVFYPNNHLQTVGKNQARADADQCMADAKAYGVKNDTGKTVGGKAVKGATLGATISAVVAAILGGNVSRCLGEMGYEVIGWP